MDDFDAAVRTLGLEALAAAFPDELRAAFATAAAQRTALLPVDDATVEPA